MEKVRIIISSKKESRPGILDERIVFTDQFDEPAEDFKPHDYELTSDSIVEVNHLPASFFNKGVDGSMSIYRELEALA